MSHTLLVPVDFSDCTYGLVEQAGTLAGRLGVGVTLLHVITPPTDAGELMLPEGVSGLDLLLQESERLLEQFASPLRERQLAVQIITRQGTPEQVILDACDEVSPLMIMMGTHGRKGVVRMLLGSVAESVIRRAEVPVVTVRTKHQPECEPRSCAVCTQRSPAELRLASEREG